ncbi:TetR/AcrR family transcriptional regulator [Actinosynnema sp. ALI-1.44]|uniref:TetR/AcrR family transcriptional regulator n=1 Tax=Actinosynnema sp. ALI-1.44 TaxID=1933779 RepID=UPI0022A934CB|nr:TetR/AcrR family transcriptional regulator [Actinosynnema sp. ALI-1.44]
MTHPSARQVELLEGAYRYVLEHGIGELSLRPLAAAIGSSPRVLLYLFGSKEGLLRALLARARADELGLLARVDRHDLGALPDVGRAVWSWLVSVEHRALLRLWVEAYSRSLVDPDGPWGSFARSTVEDWLAVLAAAQSPAERDTPDGRAERTLVLAVLRGALLDVLATGDVERVSAGVDRYLTKIS